MTNLPTIQENRQPAKNGDWYKPGKSILEFHRSKKRVRVLIGGRGCGKTTAISMESVLKHCMHVAGARVYILRKTAESNTDTTGETFEQTFAKSGDLYLDTGLSLFKKIEGGRIYRVPSLKAIEKYNEFLQSGQKTKQEINQWLDSVGNQWCGFIQFSGVPTSSVRASRFRGFECSMLILVEADQFELDDLDMAIACLRWKSPDPSANGSDGFIKDMSLILDTNPPSPRHWIAKLEEDEAKNPDSDYQFWHIPTAENEANLPKGYVKMLIDRYKKKPALLKRMVYGQYAEAFEGSPVLWAFDHLHGATDLPFPRGAFLVRGWDFGVTHANIWSAYWLENETEYWYDLFESFCTNSDAESQCRRVKEITEAAFPFWNDRSICSGLLDFCDPAGNARKDTGRTLTVLASHRIFPSFRRISLQESLSIYNRLLEARDKRGRRVYKIDTKGCPMLYEASLGGYRYPAEGEPGWGSDEPLKGPQGGNYDHVADASRYAKIGCLRLARLGEPVVKPIGVFSRNANLNRPKLWH